MNVQHQQLDGKPDRQGDLSLVGCSHDRLVSCGDCRLRGLCLPLALEDSDLSKLEGIVQRSRLLRKNEHVFKVGDTFQAVLAVRSGTFKGYTTTDDGQERVTGFYYPGEILGMDGVGGNVHASSAKALETASVCEIPFDALETLSVSMPLLQRHLFKLMSREITEDRQLISLLSKSSAEERVAALLLGISSRNARRQLSSSEFRLSMSRSDIGNYLGLTVETVSRVFSRLQKLELLHVDNKEVRIVDFEALKRMASPL